MQKDYPKIDISILLYQSEVYLQDLIKSLDALDYPKDKIQIYFIDNASPDDSMSVVKTLCKDKTYYRFLDFNRNLGFAEGHNVVMRSSEAKYIFLLNPDTIIDKQALRILVERMEQDSSIGVVDAKQLPYPHPKLHDTKTGETSWCSGAAMLIRRKALYDTGFFDGKFFMYVEDVDLSWRMWSKGWKCIHVLDAEVTHFTLDKSKHKKGDISLNEYYRSIRNGTFMRFIYGNPLLYLSHCYRVARLIPIKKWIIFLIKLSMYPCYKIFRKITKAVIKKIEYDPKDKMFLLFKSLLAQIIYYPHLIIRRRLQKSNPKHKYIKFYGWEYAPTR